MSTRRRIGVSAATTEAARRQLMQPVTCWEKAWVTPTNHPASAGLKVHKWVKTENVQQFSDDEGEVDEPLVPLIDEVEVLDGDDDDQDDAATSTQREASTALPKDSEPPSKVPSPKPQPHPLSMMSLPPTSEAQTPVPQQPGEEELDAALNPQTADDSTAGMDISMDDATQLDMSGLGPDGLGLEEAHDLSQMEPADALLGGPLMDNTDDPFASND
ncbi:hypothetical protein HGRIS_008148 [Hohenbuehelia grisea]|uniref:Uncharacterized protein n=1 Tax=Hohenbuehelia grisea TaxID=104357 RepID=A0ABR3J8J3_9AGAR